METAARSCGALARPVQNFCYGRSDEAGFGSLLLLLSRQASALDETAVSFRTSPSIAAVFFCCCVTGCVSTHHVGSSNYPPRSAESVATLYQEPNRPYEVIAFVEAKTVTIFDKPEKMMQQAKEKAAVVGADAVIFTSTGKWSGMPGIPGVASGRAIRWKR